MNGEAPVLVGCRYAEEHPRIDAELKDHARRIDTLEREGREDRRELWQSLGRLEKSVEHMKGWIAGSMLAASLVGGILAFIAARVFHG